MLVGPRGCPWVKLSVSAFCPNPVDGRRDHKDPVVRECIGISVWFQEENGSGGEKVLGPLFGFLNELK